MIRFHKIPKNITLSAYSGTPRDSIPLRIINNKTNGYVILISDIRWSCYVLELLKNIKLNAVKPENIKVFTVCGGVIELGHLETYIQLKVLHQIESKVFKHQIDTTLILKIKISPPEHKVWGALIANSLEFEVIASEHKVLQINKQINKQTNK